MKEEIQICDVCGEHIDTSKTHTFGINDLEVVGPVHNHCYAKAASEEGAENEHFQFNFDNEAHFVWPPPVSDQGDVYREFLALLQERIATLPPSEDDEGLDTTPYDYAAGSENRPQIMCTQCGGLDDTSKYPDGGRFSHHIGDCPFADVKLDSAMIKRT